MNSPNRSSNIADIEAEKSAPKPWPPAAGQPGIEGGMTEAVIGRAALRVLQRLVGLVEFLEALLGVRIAVAAVGMTFLGETAKGGLDLAVASAARYAEHLVVAPLRHRPSGPLHRRPAWRRLSLLCWAGAGLVARRRAMHSR